MSRSQRRLSLAVLPVLASGCCDLASYFCGPDRSHWVKPSYESPGRAVATFLEALRRDDLDQIYESLGEAFKARHELGRVEFEIAWKRFVGEQPVHMLGDAEVGEPSWRGDRRVRYVLERSGYRFLVGFVRQSYWEVRYRFADESGDYGLSRYFTEAESMADFVHIGRSDPRAGTIPVTVVLAAPAPELAPEEILRAGVARDWKVDEFRQLPDA